MAVRWNPYTNEFEDDEGEMLPPTSFTSTGNFEPDFSVAQTKTGPTIIDTAGNTGSFVNGTWTPTPDNTNVSWMSSLPKGVQDAIKAFTSPAGIAGLGGAALGFLDRPKPSGGGTTMAYPGAAKLERKMVQGPYGPLAEYTGVGGGAPDYTPFRAPTIAPPPPAAAPAPGAPGAGMSVQAKVDLYKQLAGYGLGPDRIRRIAETMYGAIPDTDWNELTRLAGVGAGIAAPKLGDAPAPVGAPAPGDAPAPQPVGIAAPIAAPTPSVSKEYKLPSWAVTDLDPTEKAALYNSFRSRGFSNDYIRQIAERSGAQTDKDWSALEQLALQMNQNLISGDRVPTKAEIQEAVKKRRGDTAAPAPASAPVSAPTPAVAPAPAVSEAYRYATQEGGIGEDQFYENIANFIKSTPDEAAQKAAQQQYGISDVDVYRAKLRHGLLGDTGFYASPSSGGFAQGGEARAYAGGKPLTMEDGGFVFTEKATNELGPRGIAALGGKMISAPGNGTDDKGITGIIGKNGVTPARVSNGESYFPPGHDTKKLYALMHSLERKA